MLPDASSSSIAASRPAIRATVTGAIGEQPRVDAVALPAAKFARHTFAPCVVASVVAPSAPSNAATIRSPSNARSSPSAPVAPSMRRAQTRRSSADWEIARSERPPAIGMSSMGRSTGSGVPIDWRPSGACVTDAVGALDADGAGVVVFAGGVTPTPAAHPPATTATPSASGRAA